MCKLRVRAVHAPREPELSVNWVRGRLTAWWFNNKDISRVTSPWPLVLFSTERCLPAVISFEYHIIAPQGCQCGKTCWRKWAKYYIYQARFSVLGRRLSRRPNIETPLGQRFFVFSPYYSSRFDCDFILFDYTAVMRILCHSPVLNY